MMCEGEALIWRVWPAADRPLRAVGVALFIVLVAGAAAVVSGWPMLGTVAALLLAWMVLPFYVPTEYRLDPEGVEVRLLGTRQRRAWSDLRRAVVARERVLLSPFGGPSRLEGYRGVFLRTEARSRDEVIGFVAERLPVQEASVGR